MLDGIKIAVPSGGIRVFCPKTEKFIKVDALDYTVYVVHPETKMTLTLEKNSADNKLSIKANPVSWLSGQNIAGSNDLHGLVLRVLKELVRLGRIEVSPEARADCEAGEIYIHSLAFNMYLVTDTTDKLPSMDLFKTIKGGIVSTDNPKLDTRVFLYHGIGFCLNNKSKSLTVYDKLEELKIHKSKKQDVSYFKSGLSWLEGMLRLEATLRSNYFSRQSRMLKWWRGKDMDKVVKDILLKELQFHKVEYLMQCPNVFARDYTAKWKSQDRLLFNLWLKGKVLEAKDRRRLWNLYGFDAELNVTAYRNTLWTLLRPESVTKPMRVDLSEATVFPGHAIFAPLLPLERHLKVGVDPKILRQIDKSCGLR